MSDSPIDAPPEGSFGGRLRAWSDRRSQLSANNLELAKLNPSAFTANDAAAGKLLNEIAGPLLGLALMDGGMWGDNAERFTCSEADALTNFLRVLEGEGFAQMFLDNHADRDDVGDAHWTGGYDPAEEARLATVRGGLAHG